MRLRLFSFGNHESFGEGIFPCDTFFVATAFILEILNFRLGLSANGLVLLDLLDDGFVPVVELLVYLILFALLLSLYEDVVFQELFLADLDQFAIIVVYLLPRTATSVPPFHIRINLLRLCDGRPGSAKRCCPFFSSRRWLRVFLFLLGDGSLL